MAEEKPISESLRPLNMSGKHGREVYLLPNSICATCGQSTKNSMHEKCRRKDGKLLVVVSVRKEQ